MKKLEIMLDEVIDKDLEKYLLKLNGIIEVKIVTQGFLSKVTVDYNDEITPIIIYNYIELYFKCTYPILISFDKEKGKSKKILEYVIDDMCCEYCYKGLIKLLFNEREVKSVSTDFDFNKPAFNIKFKIEYDENYGETALINFIEMNK